MKTTAQPIINDQDREELIRMRYTETEIGQMEEFLSPFCNTARTYLVRIFIRGKVIKKSLDEILAACKIGWEGTWKLGTPGRLGDSDDTAPPDVGLRNTVAFSRSIRTSGFRSCPKCFVKVIDFDAKPPGSLVGFSL